MHRTFKTLTSLVLIVVLCASPFHASGESPVDTHEHDYLSLLPEIPEQEVWETLNTDITLIAEDEIQPYLSPPLENKSR